VVLCRTRIVIVVIQVKEGKYLPHLLRTLAAPGLKVLR
jgi:hypothetical protein